ncbi:SurA N-terminal domain-containing protein [Mesobacillus selenatarsenatis]|uniref:Foldase protein PrsA n=1 Tax=Mesobacillus selenatarsenatis (strain DSM 18680 / JCM 14380 / FERM P-15431 / SF-1) TaxID=1321606 RepID=A0A0A8XEY1_MESS1|nr:SurA N-terminal domain-containing protein [Mesobacillus selenatarsenatis]GAM16701.1 foldase protein PrsA precursor [Mesobacillus selenatarsenatis SF-1]
MIKRILTGILLLSVAVLVLGACSNDSSKGNTEKENKEDMVATVDGKGISKKDYEKELDVLKATYEQQGMPVDQMDDKQKEGLEKSVLDQMINAELLLQKAEKDGISIEDKEVDTELEKIKTNFEDEKQFEDTLKKNEMTEKELKAQLKKQMTVNKYLDGKIGKLEATDEEIQAMYDQYKQMAEMQEQKPEDLEKVKPQLEQQVLSEKENEKISKLVEDLRKDNEDKIKIIEA